MSGLHETKGMSWTARDEKRKQRAKEAVPVAQLLADLGYLVRTDSEDREEQFSCDLHGDGHDGKPSARIYPDSNSWYCFACGITRDNIDTIQTKKDLSFMQAISWIEKTYRLPVLPFDPADFEKSKEEQAREELAESLNMGSTFEEAVQRFRSFMDALTIDRDLPMGKTCRFWEVFDKFCYWAAQEQIKPEVARKALVTLRERLDKALEDQRENS